MQVSDQWVVVRASTTAARGTARRWSTGAGRYLVDELAGCRQLRQGRPGRALEALGPSNTSSRSPGFRARRCVPSGWSTGPVSAEGVISSKGATNFAIPNGTDMMCAARSRSASGYPLCITTTPMRPPSMPITSVSGRRRRCGAVGVGDVGTGLGGGSGRDRAGGPRSRRDGGRAGHVRSRSTGCSAGPAGTRLQLRPARRCREHRLADRHREEPPALLAGRFLTMSSPACSRSARPRKWSGATGGRRSAGARDLRTAGGRHRPAPRDRRELPRPRALLCAAASWSVAAVPRLVSGRMREHTVLRAEQARAASIALIPHLDMAGARGSAIAARECCGAR